MSYDIGPHVNSDVLEQYAMGRLAEAEKASVEEHLLACSRCQTDLEHAEDFIRTAKTALRAMNRRPASRSTRAGAMLSWFSVPVIGVAALGLAIGTFLHSQHAPDAAPDSSTVEVRLMTSRAGDAADPQVRASGVLILDLDARDLPTDPPLEVQVVNSAGTQVWSGTPLRSGDSMQAKLTRSPAPGRYWVRLTSGGKPMREFGLSIE